MASYGDEQGFEPPPPPESGRPNWLIVAVIGVLVVLVVVLLLVLVTRDDSSSTPATSSVAPTTVQPGGDTVAPQTNEPANPCSEFTEKEDLPLALCDSGEFVAAAQEGLNAWGARIEVDGFFGPATESAVMDFQADSELEVDGIIGQNTWAALCPYTTFLCEPDG